MASAKSSRPSRCAARRVRRTRRARPVAPGWEEGDRPCIGGGSYSIVLRLFFSCRTPRSSGPLALHLVRSVSRRCAGPTIGDPTDTRGESRRTHDVGVRCDTWRSSDSRCRSVPGPRSSCVSCSAPRPSTAWAAIDDDTVSARFGRFSFSTPLANVERYRIAGPVALDHGHRRPPERPPRRHVVRRQPARQRSPRLPRADPLADLPGAGVLRRAVDDLEAFAAAVAARGGPGRGRAPRLRRQLAGRPGGSRNVPVTRPAVPECGRPRATAQAV